MIIQEQVCGTCRGTNVKADAFAVWNVGKQEWELENIFDKGSWCNDCDGECRIECIERELKLPKGWTIAPVRRGWEARSDSLTAGDFSTRVQAILYAQENAKP